MAPTVILGVTGPPSATQGVVGPHTITSGSSGHPTVPPTITQGVSGTPPLMILGFPGRPHGPQDLRTSPLSPHGSQEPCSLPQGPLSATHHHPRGPQGSLPPNTHGVSGTPHCGPRKIPRSPPLSPGGNWHPPVPPSGSLAPPPPSPQGLQGPTSPQGSLLPPGPPVPPPPSLTGRGRGLQGNGLQGRSSWWGRLSCGNPHTHPGGPRGPSRGTQASRDPQVTPAPPPRGPCSPDPLSPSPAAAFKPAPRRARAARPLVPAADGPAPTRLPPAPPRLRRFSLASHAARLAGGAGAQR